MVHFPAITSTSKPDWCIVSVILVFQPFSFAPEPALHKHFTSDDGRRNPRMFKKVALLFSITSMILAISILPDRAAAGTLEVVNSSLIELIYPDSYKVPQKKSSSVELICMRNGIHAAQFVLVSSGPIQGLQVKAGDLKGPGTIPASAVEIRYGVIDGAPVKRGKKGHFDSLEPSPPVKMDVKCGSGQVIQQLWIKLRIPANAKAGDYTGKIKISAGGGLSAEITLKAKVFDWQVKNATEWFVHMDAVQSPESVALAYNVKMWSPEHFKLLEQTFLVLKELGQKTLYISAIRRTHFGNEHAIVRWSKEDGKLIPDLTNAEKYIDLATKHLGKIPGIIFLCWEPIESMGHASGTGSARRTTDKPIQYTLWDKKKKKLKKRTGPAWGSPESKIFWKSFTDKLQPMLKKRGLEDSLLFGLIGDSRPTKTAMDDICNAVKIARWAVHSHHYCANWKGYPVGMAIALWGIHMNICNPEQGHGFGWKAQFWLSYYPREFSLKSKITELRYKMEMWMGAFSLFEMKHHKTSRYACGLGRIGADFWKVLKDKRGRVRDTLAGRYPESYWGQLNLNYCLPHIIGKGAKGPVPTVRSEAFREGNQDIEARFFIEKAIELPKYKGKVGADFCSRVRKFLDDRIRMCNALGGARKDHSKNLAGSKASWQKSNAKLYALAAEAAKKLGIHNIEYDGTPSSRQMKKLLNPPPVKKRK
jgi:Glycoside hydrolase 123, catalytic domain/Glycoside hydrolase 123 N-terminal domain